MQQREGVTPPDGPSLENDRALLDGYRRGERWALERVFERYADDVARTLRAGVVVEVQGQRTRVGGGLLEHELEVLVQETFLRAFGERARQGYDGVRPFGAYLATIARNLLIDRGRAEQRRARTHVAGQDLERLPDDDVQRDTSALLEERELSRLIGRFEEELPEPERTIFHLRYAGQKSHRETAAAIGLSEIQIRRRDSRIRTQLLAFLRQHGFLRNARVSIGTSLLGRKAKVEAE